VGLLEHPTFIVYVDEFHPFKDGFYHVVGSTNRLVCLIGQKYHEDGNKNFYSTLTNQFLTNFIINNSKN